MFSGVSSYKDANSVDQGPTLITSLVAPSPNTATQEVMASTYEFGVHKHSVHNNGVKIFILILQRRNL